MAAKVPAERARYLDALGCFRNNVLIGKSLAYVLSGPLRPQELLTIPRNMAENEGLKDYVWRWFKQNYDAIASRVPPFYVASLPHAADCCTASRIEDARSFFLVWNKPPPGTEEELAKVTDSIRDCVELRHREGPAAARILQQLAVAP